MTWWTITEYLFHLWPWIYYVCRNRNPVLCSFTYHWVYDQRNTTGVTCGPGTAYPAGAPAFTPNFYLGSCWSILYNGLYITICSYDLFFFCSSSIYGCWSGADPGFQVTGAHLKKLRWVEGGAKMFGVFRVKNHDYTQKKSYFFQFYGGGERRMRLPPWIHPCWLPLWYPQTVLPFLFCLKIKHNCREISTKND